MNACFRPLRLLVTIRSIIIALATVAMTFAAAAEVRPLALVDATVYASPGEPGISGGAIVIEGGKIMAVGRRDAVVIPERAEIVSCDGKSVLAGFWNGHVHFTEPKWLDADRQPAEQLNRQLREMLTSHGFTTVVDLASDVANTVALRQRIEGGEIAGPRILTAGLALYPENGIPYYVTDTLPPEIVGRLYAPSSPEEAVRDVEANVAAGADLIKVFLVTGVRRDGAIAVVSMSPDVLKAVVAKAHELGKIVIAHPSYLRGLELAIDSGVDVLAHTTQDPVNWTADVVARLRARNVALVPTLALFSPTREFDGILREVKTYAEAGGELLFGTDIGFLTDYAALDGEFALLGRAGLTFPQIHAMLTTAPAKRFDRDEHGGRLVAGAVADLVVLDGDPAEDLNAFTRVHITIRGGRVIYRATE